MQLKIPGLKSQKNWASVPDDLIASHPYDAEKGAIWCPVVGPGIVRSDIRLAKRAGTDGFQDFGRIGRYDAGMMGYADDYNPDSDWILYCGNEVLMVGNDRNTLRDAFDHLYRWRNIRPPALKLIPNDDEIEEILTSVVHIKDAVPGSLVLRYHLGPVLDVALIRSINKNRTKIEIAGDSVSFDPDAFLPPTTYRKNEFREGVKKLRAPVASQQPKTNSPPIYPADVSSCIPGRQELSLDILHPKRTDHYLWFEFVITNHGTETVNWLHYQWSRNSEVPKGFGPFALQNDHLITVFSVSTHGYFRTLYPGSNEKISVCVGKDVSPGQIKIFYLLTIFAVTAAATSCSL